MYDALDLHRCLSTPQSVNLYIGGQCLFRGPLYWELGPSSLTDKQSLVEGLPDSFLDHVLNWVHFLVVRFIFLPLYGCGSFNGLVGFRWPSRVGNG